MKIFIRRPGKQGFSLYFPTALLFPLLSHILSGKGASFPENGPAFSAGQPLFKGQPLSKGQRRRILRSLAHARRRHPRLTLVEVDSAAGEHVEIRW